MIPCGKILAAAALVASATMAGPAGAAPMSAPRGLENAAAAPVEAVQWRGRGGRGGYYRGRGNWVGPAIGGLAAGAIIGGALAARPYYYDGGYAAAPAYGYEYGPDDDDGAYVAVAPRSGGGDAVAYCMQRYRSYDPASGTFLGYDGMRHPCP